MLDRRCSLLLLMLFALCTCGCGRKDSGPLSRDAGAPSSTSGPFVVMEIVDGDTVWVKTKEGKKKIRLLGIDTPEITGERSHIFGLKAKAFTSKILVNKKVYLQKDPNHDDTDKYGRLLRYILTENQLNINVEIVRSGWSAYYTKYGKSALHHLEFMRAEEEARERMAGIWKDPVFLSGGYLENARGKYASDSFQ